MKEVWQKALASDIKGDSDFFSLGGHSMLALQMTSEINKNLSIKIGLRDLFLNPKFEDFEKIVNNLLASKSLDEDTEIQVETVDGHLPLNPSLKRMWIIERLDPETHVHNLANAWSLPESLNINRLEQVISKIISNNEIMRLYVEEINGMPVQRYVAKDHGFKLNHREFANIENAMSYMQENFLQKIDICQFPLFQFELLNIKDSKTILYLKKHHMIWDGMSDSVFLAKLERYYKNIDDSFDEEIPSYKDFSIKLERRKNSERYKEGLEFWKSRLSPNPKSLEITSSYPRDKKISPKAVSARVEIDLNLIDRISVFTKKYGITEFMFFIANYYLFWQKRHNKMI